MVLFMHKNAEHEEKIVKNDIFLNNNYYICSCIILQKAHRAEWEGVTFME